MEENIYQRAHHYLRRWDAVFLFLAMDAAHSSLSPFVIDSLNRTGIAFKDPVGRMASTFVHLYPVINAKNSSERAKVAQAVRQRHNPFEKKNGQIPNDQFVAVWSSLVFTALRSSQWLSHGKILQEEKASIYSTFLEIGEQMGITELPPDIFEWQTRWNDIKNQMKKTELTSIFYRKISSDLGVGGSWALLHLQNRILDKEVRDKLGDLLPERSPLFDLFFAIYPFLPEQKATRWVLQIVKEPARKKLLSLMTANA